MFNELFPDDAYDLVSKEVEIREYKAECVVYYLDQNDQVTSHTSYCENANEAVHLMREDLKYGFVLVSNTEGIVMVPLHRVRNIQILTAEVDVIID